MSKLTQQERLLQAMKIRPQGLNSYIATYDLRIKQAPTRILELKDKGYNIVSLRQENGSVNWVLDGKIKEELKPEYKWVFEDGMARQVLINRESIQQQLI